jgi:hypothetical protein
MDGRPPAAAREIGDSTQRGSGDRGARPQPQPPEYGQGALVKHGVFSSLAQLFAQAAERRSLLLVLDDLHRADPISLELLRFWIDELARTRVAGDRDLARSLGRSEHQRERAPRARARAPQLRADRARAPARGRRAVVRRGAARRSHCEGPVALLLGLLAQAGGRNQEATKQLEASVALAQRAGLLPAADEALRALQRRRA